MAKYTLLGLAVAMLLAPHGLAQASEPVDLGIDSTPEIQYDYRVCKKWKEQTPRQRSRHGPRCIEWGPWIETDDAPDCWEDWQYHLNAAAGILIMVTPWMRALPPWISIPIYVGTGGIITYCSFAEGQ